MHNQRDARNGETGKRWKVTLYSEDAPSTVVTGLSQDQARQAMSALVAGDHDAIAQLAAKAAAIPLKRAA